MGAPNEPFTFLGHGANVVGSLGSGSLVQDMPVGFYLSGASTAGKITIPNDATLNTVTGSMTICAWIKPEVWDNSYMSLSSKSGNFHLRTNSGPSKLEFTWYDGTDVQLMGYSPSNDLPLTGSWSHVAATVINNVPTALYMNGQVTDAVPTFWFSGGTDTTNDFKIGDNDYQGHIRDVRYFAGSGLTAGEINEVYEDVNMVGGTATGSLAGWWKLQDDSATIADSSVNTNNGTYSGASWDQSTYNLNQIGSGSVSGAPQ